MKCYLGSSIIDPEAFVGYYNFDLSENQERELVDGDYNTRFSMYSILRKNIVPKHPLRGCASDSVKSIP
ncbi:MAG: hypothetical protein ACMUEK_01540 [Sodalis sp. (in: enterobacteria)]